MVLNLICKLEEYYPSILKCTVFQGSVIQYLNKNIPLLGDRKSGKTTLTYYLTQKQNAFYLDDDCIYMTNNKLFGFNMPLAMRTSNTDNPICSVMDTENIIRYLYNIKLIIDHVSHIDYVIFPKYNPHSLSEVRKIQGAKLFQLIIYNVRNSSNIKSLFSDIKFLCDTTSSYSIIYPGSEDACELLLNIIKQEISSKE